MADPATIAMIASTAVSAAGTLAGGAAQQAQSDYQAAQLQQRANTERASAQREAIEERRQADLAISRARAVGAASGGGLDFDRMGDIAGEGEYRALTSLWEGEERARGASMQARARRMEGKNAMGSAAFDAAGTLLKGGSKIASMRGKSLKEKYG